MELTRDELLLASQLLYKNTTGLTPEQVDRNLFPLLQKMNQMVKELEENNGKNNEESGSPKENQSAEGQTPVRKKS